jgi:hypothetical protein
MTGQIVLSAMRPTKGRQFCEFGNLSGTCFVERALINRLRMISASSTKTFNKARSTQIAKFTKLTSFGRTHRRQEDLASHPLQRTIINMSARRLTPVEEDVLALGLNFAVVPPVFFLKELIATAIRVFIASQNNL